MINYLREVFRNRARVWFILIALVTTFCIYVVWPNQPKKYLPGFIPWPSGAGLHLGGLDRREMRLGLDLKGGTRVVVAADLAGRPADEINSTMKTVVGILERRVNALGVSETQITREGTDRVAVEIPGLTADQALRLVGTTAQLEFKELATPISLTPGAPNYLPGPYCQTVKDWKPATAVGNGGQTKTLTGSFLKSNARLTADQNGLPAVGIQFNSEGASMFSQITQRELQQPVGIFLDNQCISAPVVQSHISDGNAIITGLQVDTGKTLAAQLNAGALPVPLHVVEESQVDATLGSDSVSRSVLAGFIGFGVVALFMILYYRLPGVLAALALMTYASVVLAIFKLVPVTLSLAGVAAFVLSIGMAVDANILIFERTKEELRTGKSLTAAIDAGFSRAWPSIRDSNASTLITSGILYWFGDQFGNSLIKGFALTLAIGVVVSLFSAILVTRTYLRLIIGTRSARNLWLFGAQRLAPLPEGAPRPKLPGWLNLVGKRKWYYVLSVAIMVPGLISLAAPPHLRPGIEFTSGTTFTLKFSNPPSSPALLSELSRLGYGDAQVQKSGSNAFIVRTRPLEAATSRPVTGPAPPSDLDRIRADLANKFNSQVTVPELSTVSPIVSAQIVRQAAIAVLVATLGILLYIAFAFRQVKHPVRYGTCAVIALLHDVVVVVGLFSIFGRLFHTQVDTLFLTAVLTVIGFSVHDTIVVFDRIRENLHRSHDTFFDHTVNESLIQTLDRSVNTSMTVLFALLALLLFGGVTIHEFVLALLIGIASGTYSSIAIASQLLVEWHHGNFSRPFRRLRNQLRRRAPSVAQPAP